jgi:hypothetical protein
MMVGLCLIPLVIVGYTQTIQTEWHTSKDISGPSLEVQSCAKGLGARVAAGEEWVQVGPQYGYTWSLGQGWAITGQVHGGLGYSNTFHPTTGIRQVTKWNGGVDILLHYGRYNVKVGYDHMSNGRGLDPTNHGQDMMTVGVGYSF